MAGRFTYREFRAMERHYCRENDEIVGFFGGSDEDDREESSENDD